MNEKYTRAFKDISTAHDLIEYLCDSKERLKNSGYIYHYTTLPVLIKMLKSKTWHLAAAYNMNDRLEYESGDIKKWNNIFFSSFMTEDKESIGMWSMYAQPWEKGIKIAIPSFIALKWIKNTTELSEVSMINYETTGRTVDFQKEQIKLSSVAYCNTNSLTRKDTEEKLCWSNVTNTILRSIARDSIMTGYIKDMAWAYEKEIRIKAEFHNYQGFERVAIDLPEYVVDSMIITASPLFKGELTQEIKKEIQHQLKTDKSLFTGRLNIKTICQTCEFMKAI